jgi:hypothetical protein
MRMRKIPLDQLERDPRGMLRECCDRGQALVVEMPDHRLIAIHALDFAAEDDLTSALIEANPEFRALLEQSLASGKKPFVAMRD